jgi:hypothetical protein
VPYREHVPPDVTARIFWLKNRKPHEWRDVQNIEHAIGKYIISDKPMTESPTGRRPRRSGSVSARRSSTSRPSRLKEDKPLRRKDFYDLSPLLGNAGVTSVRAAGPPRVTNAARYIGGLISSGPTTTTVACHVPSQRKNRFQAASRTSLSRSRRARDENPPSIDKAGQLE